MTPNVVQCLKNGALQEDFIGDHLRNIPNSTNSTTSTTVGEAVFGSSLLDSETNETVGNFLAQYITASPSQCSAFMHSPMHQNVASMHIRTPRSF